ncbi:unnamed protein product [Lasius platythorax]|uniref:Uncharacterized protein n=1 Tax=Lasius platythorax TaxID=488582 RepID=A0AAV2N387_9HYME
MVAGSKIDRRWIPDLPGYHSQATRDDSSWRHQPPRVSRSTGGLTFRIEGFFCFNLINVSPNQTRERRLLSMIVWTGQTIAIIALLFHSDVCIFNKHKAISTLGSDNKTVSSAL